MITVKHEWKFDLPWHMVFLRDWFYVVSVRYIEPSRFFLHVRIAGVCSRWIVTVEDAAQRWDSDLFGESLLDFMMPRTHPFEEERYRKYREAIDKLHPGQPDWWAEQMHPFWNPETKTFEDGKS